MHNRHLLRLFVFFNKIYINLFSAFYKKKNKNKPRILIYTDSRGFEVTKMWNRKNPFSSYVKNIIKQYNADHYVCPEFSTTYADFFAVYNEMSKKNAYDAVICHVGLVDYSVRPQTMVEQMYTDKMQKVHALGISCEQMRLHISQPLDEIYEGKATNRFISLEMFKSYIEPKLEQIPNLIMIGMNKVRDDWDGAYWKKRPETLNENMIFDQYISEKFDNYISLSDWSKEQVKEYTCDNIHLNPNGFDVVWSRVKRRLDVILGQK